MEGIWVTLFMNICNAEWLDLLGNQTLISNAEWLDLLSNQILFCVALGVFISEYWDDSHDWN